MDAATATPAAVSTEVGIQEGLNEEYLLDRIRAYIDQQFDLHVQEEIEPAISASLTDLNDRWGASIHEIDKNFTAMYEVDVDHGECIDDFESSKEVLHDSVENFATIGRDKTREKVQLVQRLSAVTINSDTDTITRFVKGTADVQGTDKIGSLLTTHIEAMHAQLRCMQAEMANLRGYANTMNAQVLFLLAQGLPGVPGTQHPPPQGGYGFGPMGNQQQFCLVKASTYDKMISTS